MLGMTPILVTQPKVNLSHSIIGNKFFMKFECRFQKSEVSVYSDVTFNDIHKTLLEVRNTQEFSNPEVNIKNERQSTTKSNSIREKP